MEERAMLFVMSSSMVRANAAVKNQTASSRAPRVGGAMTTALAMVSSAQTNRSDPSSATPRTADAGVSPAEPSRPDVPAGGSGVIFLLAAGAGVTVACLYYYQPILAAIARSFGASPSAAGLLATLTQVGYGAGVLLFAPLGDRFDLRRVIVVKGVALSGTMVLAALAPSLGVLAAASLIAGLLATTAQDFVPAAAALAPAGQRGRTVGIAMTGLLLGILLSRVVSGFVGEHFGWRSVYFGAAALVAVMVALARLRLPSIRPAAQASYGQLLGSIVALARKHPPLRRAALGQGLLAIGFSGFWSTLSLVLARPEFGYGSTVAGAFGIAGAAGALAAPIAGGLADRRSPGAVLRITMLLVVASFASLALAPTSMVVLVLATLVFDLGVQGSLIAHQTIVYGLDATARSRLNAVLMSTMFVGMATGSAIAAQLAPRYGLVGVGALGSIAAAAAWLVRAR